MSGGKRWHCTDKGEYEQAEPFFRWMLVICPHLLDRRQC
jgi:predicted membrane-bound dolichyl-phosphate-mannose-protein mannosyltransferase